MRDERRQAVQELEQERRGREETERELEDLRRQLQALRGSRESPEKLEEQGRGERHPDAPDAQEGVQRPWWRRVLGR